MGQVQLNNEASLGVRFNEQISKYRVHEGVKYDCNYCDHKLLGR